MGTDSAPHAVTAKETSCGCAGVFSAHASVEFYAEVFESCGKLHLLEVGTHDHCDIASLSTLVRTSRPSLARPSTDCLSMKNTVCFRAFSLHFDDRPVELIREPWVVPDSYALGGDAVVCIPDLECPLLITEHRRLSRSRPVRPFSGSV
jgi:dihydroorotase